jgi:hypothetical protein
MNREPLEKQIFDYESYAPIDDDSVEFHEITLKVAVGEHPVGAKFPAALLNIAGSMLGLVNEEGDETYYELTVQVGKEITQDDFAYLAAKSNDMVH